MTSEDELAIRNILARVAHITDGRGSLEEYLTLWTEDSTWESPVAGSFRGHAGHLERHARYRAAGVQGPDADSFHLVTTVYVKVEGDEASSMSSWLYVSRSDSEPRNTSTGPRIASYSFHSPVSASAKVSGVFAFSGRAIAGS